MRTKYNTFLANINKHINKVKVGRKVEYHISEKAYNSFEVKAAFHYLSDFDLVFNKGYFKIKGK